jgi:hypothetical protein
MKNVFQRDAGAALASRVHASPQMLTYDGSGERDATIDTYKLGRLRIESRWKQWLICGAEPLEITLRAYPLLMESKAGSKFRFCRASYRKTASHFSGRTLL